MRIQATCSSISLIYRMILKKSKVTSIPDYEGIEMLENRIQERMLEYSRVLNIESAYISLNIRDQAVCSSTRSVERKSIVLDNLWFWTSDKLNEYAKEACNLLTMNVELFTSVGKNLHGHNFQSSWRIVTQIGNLPPIKQNFRMRD